MIKLKNRNKGMAIVIVLCFSAILVAYGTIMMSQHKDSAPVSKMQLERIQADFFAKGIQNIVLFKIKQLPDFFLKSYRQYAWGQRKDLPEAQKLTTEQVSKQAFINYFMNDEIFGAAKEKFWSPLKLDYYSAELKLLNAEDFKNETIEVSVEVKFPGKKAFNKYVAVINGDMREHKKEGSK